MGAVADADANNGREEMPIMATSKDRSVTVYQIDMVLPMYLCCAILFSLLWVGASQPQSHCSSSAPPLLRTFSLHFRGASATVPLLLLSSSIVKDLQPSLQIWSGPSDLIAISDLVWPGPSDLRSQKRYPWFTALSKLMWGLGVMLAAPRWFYG
ncbi:unnamed protein product [Ilex paraguariensis]|uniref:Uncharacterized protein n=1 Tax=Ilex paraguariensis TaxID=185542 RepID=A0ABC8UFL2_9AQUA